MASELSNYELAQLASKDIEAFNELYTRHHRRVHSLCLSYTKDYALSEDLTQEVFIQLFKKIHTFNNESAFETWLHRITVNQIISYKRRKSAHEMQLPEDHIVEAVTSPVHNPIKIKIEMSMILHQSINALPKETKRVFILSYVLGLSQQEVANEIGRSIGTVKSQESAARKKLREMIS